MRHIKLDEVLVTLIDCGLNGVEIRHLKNGNIHSLKLIGFRPSAVGYNTIFMWRSSNALLSPHMRATEAMRLVKNVWPARIKPSKWSYFHYLENDGA